jgi:hypothetical protein
MLPLLRSNPGIIISVALLAACLIVCVLVGLLMARGGASLRPVYWLAGFFALVIVPQIVGHFWMAATAGNASAPRTHALEQLAPHADAEARQSAVKLLFGPDADALLVTDVRPGFGDAFAQAEYAQFATLPTGDTVLLARFKGYSAAEKGWFYYLRNTGLNQLDGTGDSQRGYAVTRPVGDRAFVLHMGDLVGIWTGADDGAIRARMTAGGFEIPRRAPLAEVAAGILPAVEGGILPPGKSVATSESSEPTSTSAISAPHPPDWKPGSTAGRMPAATSPLRTILIGVAFTLYLLLVVAYFFKGAAWAATYRAQSGVAPVTAIELATRLEAVNSLDVPFSLGRGEQPNEFLVTWRYADAKWIDLARARGMRRTFRIRLTLDERSGVVRATDYSASYDWSAGRGGANIEWKAAVGIVFFQYQHQRVFGLQLDEKGRFKPELSYAYTFNVNEMKSPLIEAVTCAGWNWRPTIWQGPKWLRWLTE